MPVSYYIDIPTALITLLAFIHGYRKGVLAFVMPFVAIAAALLLFPILNNIFAVSLNQYNVNVFFKILLLIILYVVVRMLLEKFRTFIEGILKVIFLQWINKIVGGFFVAFIALFLIWLMYVVLAFVIPNNPLELDSIILNNITNIVFTRFDIYDKI